MHVNSRLTTPDNFRFVIASDTDIARAVLKRDDSNLWTFREVFESLKQCGEAAKIWLEILKEGVPSFAQSIEAHNLVPSVLRDELATLISGTTVTPTFKANYIALGTGSTAAANSDTQLGTESVRALFTNRSATLNVAYLDCFFPTSVVGGNSYNEIGIFVDGAAGANTGYLLSRVLSTITLGANQTLTINASVTIS